MKKKLELLKKLADKTSARVAVGAGALVAMGSAHAAAGDPDLSAVTAAAVTVGLVGAAVFAVNVGMKVFKWMRGAL